MLEHFSTTSEDWKMSRFRTRAREGGRLIFIHYGYGHIGRQSAAHQVQQEQRHQQGSPDDAEEIDRAGEEVVQFPPCYT